MKAWVLENIGQFKPCEVPVKELTEEHVRVKVKAAGICGSDIARVYENGAHKMPLIIGHEFSGLVEETGKNTDRGWCGKKVGIFPLIPCKSCPACRQKKYEMCAHYSYLGSREDGGFAEYVNVPEWNLIELPDNVAYEQAAMLEPMAVAVHSIRRLNLSEDMTVCVCGLGTIGRLVIMFLKEMGIKNIIAVGKNDNQRLREAGEVADAYFDCVGKNETLLLGLEITKCGGQLCMVGNPYSDMHIDKNIYWKLLRKQLSVFGTWNSSFLGIKDENADRDDWHYVLNCLKENRIKPEELITHRLSMDNLDQGFHIMRDKTETYTKIMLVNDNAGK